MIVIGNKAYKQCPDCLKLVRITGFLAGWHLCLTPEELARKSQARVVADRHSQEPKS